MSATPKKRPAPATKAGKRGSKSVSKTSISRGRSGRNGEVDGAEHMNNAGLATAISLSAKHRTELRASGLTDETIAAAGIYSATSGEVHKILDWANRKVDWGTGMAIPYRFPAEAETTYYRIKLDFPRSNGDGKVIKYESPRRSTNRAFFPPGFFEALDSGCQLLLTEGEKKTLATMQAGFPCIGLPGVWGWQQKRLKSDTGRAYGERRLIANLASINWKGRQVIIVFDSDAVTNSSVQLAEVRLAESLGKVGATVRVARLPANGDDKVGVDDFLVAHGDNGPAELAKIINAATEPEKPPTPSPMDWGRMFLEEHFTHEYGLSLRWWRDELWRWDGKHYVKVSESELTAIVFTWLDDRRTHTKPSHAKEVVKALEALCRVPFSVEQPAFIKGNRDINPHNIISVTNGLLDIGDIGGDLDLHDHTPVWFSPTSLPYAFDQNAGCAKWDSFLREVLENDDRIELLQKWFGLCLVPDTSYQKLLMMVGPKRSGKGTVLRTLQHVIGPDACVSPTLSSLASDFGLWQLIGKTVAMFPDAHLGHRVDSIRILEVIKSIVGEDSVSINRKNLPYLPNCRLSVRFIITVNELPRFSDASDALGARLIILPFEKSFAERMDRTLEGKLKAEAAGILNWSLRGLYALRESGGFHVPVKSQAMLDNYRRLTSPVSGFIEDCCAVGPEHQIACSELYAAWGVWADANGHKQGASPTFGTHLRAAEPSIDRRRVRVGERLAWHYIGVGLSEDAERICS